jgi:hypothetical protein
MGFTLDEVQRLKNYEVVFAFPIDRITTSGLATAQPHCVGVLSVDCADEDFDHVSRPDDTFTRLSWHAHRHGTLLNEFLEDLPSCTTPVGGSGRALKRSVRTGLALMALRPDELSG